MFVARKYQAVRPTQRRGRRVRLRALSAQSAIVTDARYSATVRENDDTRCYDASTPHPPHTSLRRRCAQFPLKPHACPRTEDSRNRCIAYLLAYGLMRWSSGAPRVSETAICHGCDAYRATGHGTSTPAATDTANEIDCTCPALR